MRHKCLFFLLCFLLSFFRGQAQDFFDLNTISEIRIQFNQSNWNHLLDSLKENDDQEYLTAPTVEINGQFFANVGVKYKGNNAYDPDFAKKPLDLELDHVVNNQNYQGIKDIKLNNGYSDPSFVREALSFELLNRYAEAPRANYTKVWINGEYQGLYVNIEHINKRFVRDRFFTDGENPFFKCNPADYDGPGTGGNYSDLVYIGADSSAYEDKYKLESDYGWRELILLMDSLKNHPEGLAAQLDVDRVLWMLAFNNVLVNLDSYTGAYAQNYYLYLDENGRWLPVVWDLNLDFGAFPLLTPPGGFGGLPLTLTQMQQLDPLVQANNTSRPLISQLLAQPVWRRMYLAHLRTLLEENFSNGAYALRAQEIQGLIADEVQNDPKKFFSYADFQANLDTGVDGGFAGTVPGLTQLMDPRSAFLSAHPALNTAPPAFGSYAAQALNGNVVNIGVQITDADAAWVGWRFDSAAVFQRALLYDDGLHQDGAAGDGFWGAFFPLTAPRAQYFIYAENAEAGRFLPARAEHEFFVFEIPLATAGAGEVVINEVLADNETGSADEAGEREDWLELYNTTDKTLSLAGLFLSDKPAQPALWSFPAGAYISAGGYRIVWLDEDPDQGAYHANFKLSADGETLRFSGPALQLYDQVVVGAQQPDLSFGRYPNGSGPFVSMPTTFNGPNSLSSGQEDAAVAPIRIYPNPSSQLVRIEAPALQGPIEVFDALGRRILVRAIKNHPSVDLDFGPLPAGMYYIRIAPHFSRPVLVQH